MKVRVVILVFTFLSVLNGFAQRPIGESKEKLEQLRIAFISEELNLTVEEGQSFWPLFNEFSDKRDALDVKKREASKKLLKSDVVSENEVKSSMEIITQVKLDVVMLEDQFIKDCLPVLGADKTRRLIRLEQKFKKRMLEKLKHDKRPRN